MIVKNYETIHICGQISKVIGRRYNIRPDLEQDMEPEVKGYLYKETVAGFFRAWKLNEMHLEIIKIVNEMRIAEKTMVVKRAGAEGEEITKLINECVVMGLLCENHVVFKNDTSILLYLVDTGGIFAFEEAEIPYRKLSYTTGMDKRINIYRKNIFLTENNLTENETAPLIFYERITGTEKDKELKGATLLVDLGIAGELKIEEEVGNELEAIRKVFGTNAYDLGNRKYL